jgi:hypothetical protein
VVQINGDGAAYPPKTVNASGVVTLDGAHSLKISVGLEFTPEMTTLRPSMQTGAGDIVFVTKGFNRLYILFKDTVGAKVNGRQLPFRSSSDPMGKGVTSKTEIYKVTETGYDSDTRVTIKQEQPLPITILALAGKLQVGDE